MQQNSLLQTKQLLAEDGSVRCELLKGGKIRPIVAATRPIPEQPKPTNCLKPGGSPATWFYG